MDYLQIFPLIGINSGTTPTYNFLVLVILENEPTTNKPTKKQALPGSNIIN